MALDGLDMRLFQAVTRRRLAWFAGSDPRVSARAIARELGLDRSTVSARLRQWEQDGFVMRRILLPNPRLFGVGMAACSLRIAEAAGKPEALEALRLVDGVNSALDSLGPQLVVGLADDGAGAVGRRLRLLERLPHVEAVGAARPFPTPPPARQPTALDWRIMRAVFPQQDASAREVAAALGVSPRTLRRRFAALVEGGALWHFHLFDFTQYTGAVAAFLVVGVDEAAAEARVTEALRKALPPFTEYPGMHSLVWERPGRPRQLFVHLESVGAVEEAQRAALAVEGVVATEVHYPRQLHIFDHWWAECLERAAPGESP